METLISALIVVMIICVLIAVFVLLVVVWAWLSEDFAVFRELNERLAERFRRKRDGR